jgi:PIN domain nuclease of toxin-antitoxin system
MELARILLDTDVVINWLIQETESVSGRGLWKAPYEIVKLVEKDTLSGIISITTLMEVRYLLRRKKSYTAKQIENDLSKIITILDVIIPDEITLLRANTLQAEYPLDPFDSIHLSICIGLKPITLISRDKNFIKISKQFINASIPEEFLRNI